MNPSVEVGLSGLDQVFGFQDEVGELIGGIQAVLSHAADADGWIGGKTAEKDGNALTKERHNLRYLDEKAAQQLYGFFVCQNTSF